MKHNFFIPLFCICGFSANAQTVLHRSTALPRVGDKIYKQEINFFPCGDSGSGRVWQLDHITPVEEQYELVYTGNDSLFTGIEHRTQYKYRMQGDSLWKIGVENPATYQEAVFPELLAVYPMQSGDSIESFFGYTGEYQHAYGMELLGKTTVSADAEGTLIIAGDTIPNVLRVHTQRRFVRDLNLYGIRPAVEDSALWLSRFRPDSILHRISTDTLITQTDTYSWYASGYRYPVVETVENTLIRCGTPESHFRTGFYYPPVEQYYSLDEDRANQQRREEASLERQKKEEPQRNGSFKLGNHLGQCKFYQDQTHLVVEYILTTSCEVEMALYTVQGELLAIYPKKEQSPGQYRESIAIDPSVSRHYILRLVVNGEVYGEKI